MKRRQVSIIVALMLTAAVLTLIVGPWAVGSQRGREIAARFIGVASDQLESVARNEHDTGTQELWRWSSPDGSDVIHVLVAGEEPHVANVWWNDGAATEGQPRVSQEEALLVARDWAQRFPAFDPGMPASYLLKDYGRQCAGHQFRWSGLGPDGQRYSIKVIVDVVSGRPLSCSAIYWPPQPETTMPVVVSRDEAREIARATAAKISGLKVASIHVSEVNTASPFRPPGEPVYVVSLDGTMVVPGVDEVCGYADTWGVHATTGTLLMGPGQVADDGAVE